MRYSTEEKLEPSFPIPVVSDSHEPIIVLHAVDFEKVTQIQQWPLKDFALAKQERNKQSAHPPVAVEEWMNRLELRVRQTEMNQRRQRLGIVQELFEVIQCRHHTRHWCCDEARVCQ